MKGSERRATRTWRAARSGALSLVGLAVLTSGCLNRPLEPIEPRTTSTIIEKITQNSVDKIDLLLAIDNSASMADKQQILQAAVPDLVNRLVNPVCVDEATKAVAASQPAGPTDECPGGSQREFAPILDIHIGIVSSSLGDHGASSACPNTEVKKCGGGTNTSNNDHGRLITRTDPCTNASAATYQNLGFLAWDPKGRATPPGEGSVANLVSGVKDLVIGTGQIGCGFEAQNESWYRFLIDPNPPENVAKNGDKAVVSGTDATVLQQRREFLRPDSLLAIIMLTDENDCSMKEGGYNWVAAEAASNFQLWKPRAVCAQNPNDPCCTSCQPAFGAPPSSCPADPTCANPDARLPVEQDGTNLRCWANKRRFGYDFLYPTARYVNALTQPTIDPTQADLSIANAANAQPNPIFSDLKPEDANSTIRDPGLVFLAGIVGVPWQSIARDPSNLTLGFKTPSELDLPGQSGQSGWDAILGKPSASPPVDPTDAHMIESVDPRPQLAGPASANGTDPVHGHEYSADLGASGPRNDLQFACIFPLAQPRSCPNNTNCGDCREGNDSPLCDTDPQNGGKRTRQVNAKAYPGTRHLEILRGLSDQGIVASVCPKEVVNTASAEYGYRPAIGAIVDRLKTKLGGQCLPRALKPDQNGQVSCLILEARKADQCSCAAPRRDVSVEHQQAKAAALADPLARSAQWNCFCEIDQLTGDPLNVCQTNPGDDRGLSADGWCYVDPAAGAGQPAIVDGCPDAEKRKIRFVGDGNAVAGSTLFITCSGDN